MSPEENSAGYALPEASSSATMLSTIPHPLIGGCAAPIGSAHMTREDFLLLAVTSGPSQLADQLPVLASVFSVHEESGDRVYLAEFAAPLRFPLPGDVDRARCAPEYLDEDEDGAFVWTYFAAVRPDLSTERAVAPRRKEMSAGLGILADQAAAVDGGPDLASVIWAATVKIGQVEPTPPVELAEPATEPLQLPEQSTVVESPEPHTWEPVVAPQFNSPQFTPSHFNRRRIALLIGIALTAALLAIAAAVLLNKQNRKEPVPSIETSTPATTSTTTATSSAPPPPPPTTTTSETPEQTYVPYNPPRQSRTNITTPQTRPPDISVRPTHRPAFPNQPG